MAHITERVGVYAELIAEAALMASGYIGVGKPSTHEYYDLSAIDPLSREHKTFQVKTLKRRKDRNSLVLYAKKGDGTPYGPDEQSDYYIGVLIDDGEVPKVYVMENEGLKEYWSVEPSADKRWIEIPIALDRTVLTEETGEIKSEGVFA